MRAIRGVAAGAVVVGAVVGMPAAAGAVVSGNGLTCTGRATITTPDGKIFQLSSADSKADVPREGTVAYEGSTSPTSHDHSGAVKLDLGLGKVTVWSWSGKNASNLPGSKGQKTLPSALKQVPPGEYELSGSHTAKEGSCSGHITLVVEGGLLSNAAGVAALAGTVVTGAGMVLAGMAKAGAASAAGVA